MNPDFSKVFNDTLTDLELRIARRADELARAGGAQMGLLCCWLQAEAEILTEIPGFRRLMQGNTATSVPEGVRA